MIYEPNYLNEYWRLERQIAISALSIWGNGEHPNDKERRIEAGKALRGDGVNILIQVYVGIERGEIEIYDHAKHVPNGRRERFVELMNGLIEQNAINMRQMEHYRRILTTDKLKLH